MPDPLSRLSALFERFPGIGPRQAGRFVQFLLRHPAARRELLEGVQSLGSAVHQCPQCERYHAGEKPLCGICANPNRDQSILTVVASDADLLALERSGTYRGQYFVLGGTVSFASEKAPLLRTRELKDSVARRAEVKEIILAFPANPEGDATANRVREELAEAQKTLRISTLGRGLSTGSELEYADPETLRSAFDNRK